MAEYLLLGGGIFDPGDGDGEYPLLGGGIVSVEAAGGTTHETSYSQDLTPAISQVSIITKEASFNQDLVNTISQSVVATLENQYSQNLVSSISEIADLILETDLTLNHIGQIAQSSTVDYIGSLTITFVNSQTQTATATSEEEVVIDIPLYVGVGQSATGVLGVDYNQNLISDVAQSGDADFQVLFNQNLVNAVVQIATALSDNDAEIGVALNLSDEYSTEATLNNNISFNVGQNIQLSGGNILEALFSTNILSAISQGGVITIEGDTTLNLAASISQSLQTVFSGVLGLDVNLDQLQSTDGVILAEYIDGITLGDGWLAGQELFVATDVGVSVAISQNGFTTDFVIDSPEKRVLLSLDSNRVVISLNTDRKIMS